MYPSLLLKRRVHGMLAEFVVHVIPAKAGIQICNVAVRFKAMDFRFRGNDGASRTGLRFLGRFIRNDREGENH
jgi:hypothetical protein